MKLNFHINSTASKDIFLKIENLSTIESLRKKVAFVRRPFRNLRVKQDSRSPVRPTTRSPIKKKQVLKEESVDPLTPAEIQEAEIWILKREQRKYFGRELETLQKVQNYGNDSMARKISIAKSSNLYNLTPFLDEAGLIRLGWRIERSPLSFDARHPIILGKDSYVAELLIGEAHEKVKHFGFNTVLAYLRYSYWPIRGRECVKKVLWGCVICRKWHGNPGDQLMADLPASRVDGPNPPSTTTWVDFFGPIITKAGYRGGRRGKRYGVIFTFFQTRAEHKEVAQSLSTDNFLMVSTIFLARRSKPGVIFSEQATNFIGGEKEMRKTVQELLKDNDLKTKLHQEGLKWTSVWYRVRTHDLSGGRLSLTWSSPQIP